MLQEFITFSPIFLPCKWLGPALAVTCSSGGVYFPIELTQTHTSCGKAHIASSICCCRSLILQDQRLCLPPQPRVWEALPPCSFSEWFMRGLSWDGLQTQDWLSSLALFLLDSPCHLLPNTSSKTCCPLFPPLAG